jgi:hypothetical protein
MPTGYGLLPELDGGLRTIIHRATVDSAGPPAHAAARITAAHAAPPQTQARSIGGRLGEALGRLVPDRFRRAPPIRQ